MTNNNQVTADDTGQLAVVAGNVVNLHAEPNAASEQVSQAILGQPAWIEAGQNDWVYIRTWDGYRAWALARWIVPRISCSAYASGHKVAVVKSLFSDIHTEPAPPSEIITKVVVTTELEVVGTGDEWITITMPDGRVGYIRHSDVRLLDRVASNIIIPPTGDKLVETANRFMGVPYLWGGTTPFGLDCSGFMQIVYHIHHVTLLRDAHMQANDARTSALGAKPLKPGDLVFFMGGSDRQKITHVGMAIGDGEFIHSAGGIGVTISRLDEPRYLDIYWGARRMRCGNWESGCPVEG